ncbi:MAG: hypothetical protein OIN66_17380 [Candidatus Methanoperedens sp.]|nr:hypothetical protein [Candidatus Methanoperedens sp.]
MNKITNGLLLLFIITMISFPSDAEGDINSSVLNEKFFKEIYLDGVSADSDGFKLLLRANERQSGVHYQPYVVDINFILKDGENVIYSEKLEQISVGGDISGSTEIYQPWSVTLENNKEYTAIAEIYFYKDSKRKFLSKTSVVFTATMDAAITDIYGDSIGASATVKGKSMVPLEAKVIFVLKQGINVLEVKEIKAPFIMSNDREKTVDILWSKHLAPGDYIISSELREKEVIAMYDKAITVKKPESPSATSDQMLESESSSITPHQMREPGNLSSKPNQLQEISGFMAFIALIAALIVIRLHRER